MSASIANQLTVLRILIVPFFIATVMYYVPGKDHLRYAALALFITAAVLDFLDGYLARKFHQETRAGAILDPLADKILIISAFICLYKVGVFFNEVRFPIWLVVAVISRDAILIMGAMVIHLTKGGMTIAPTVWGKATAFFQFLAVIGFLLQWRLSMILWYIILFLVVVSGIDYLVKGVHELNSGEKS